MLKPKLEDTKDFTKNTTEKKLELSLITSQNLQAMPLVETTQNLLNAMFLAQYTKMKT
jgi:hypothetical protein